MEIIELNSVGCVVNENGITFPMNDEAINTGCFDNEDGGVHIMDCVDEWWECMTKDECFKVLEFLETNGVIDMGFFPEGKDTKWASNVYHISGDGMEVV